MCVCVLKLTFLCLRWRWTDVMSGFGFVLSDGALMKKENHQLQERAVTRGVGGGVGGVGGLTALT